MRKAKILIAEDTAQAAELLEAFLPSEEFELAFASDGDQALRKVVSWQPDLILLDVMMPHKSGFEVCKQLRANAATRDIAVLMVTALDQPSDVERAVEAGTDDFLSKPIKQAELLHRVRSLLRVKSPRGELDRLLDYLDEVEKPEKK